MKSAPRLGVIFPGGGGAELEYYQAVEASQDNARMYVAISRSGGDIGGGDHSIESLLETARVDYLEDAARRLGRIGVDSVMWACTSGSFVAGAAGARRQADAISATAHAPASSTSLAFIAAMASLDLKRVAVVSPYPRETTDQFLAFLAAFQISAVKYRRLDLRSGWDSTALDRKKLVEVCLESDDRAAQALVIPDTALLTLEILPELEQTLAKPVLSANQVTVWEAFHLAGSRPPLCLGCLNGRRLVQRFGALPL